MSIFIKKYKQLLAYRLIAENKLSETGNHKHHIIPKSVQQFYPNLSHLFDITVVLRPDEHAVAHYYLWQHYRLKKNNAAMLDMRSAMLGLFNNIKITTRYKFQEYAARLKYCKTFKIKEQTND